MGSEQCYTISINCLNSNISVTIEKTMFHVDNDFHISHLFVLHVPIMKIFFANISRIALNLTVHRNEYYDWTIKIMLGQEPTCQKWLQSNLICIVL